MFKNVTCYVRTVYLESNGKSFLQISIWIYNYKIVQLALHKENLIFLNEVSLNEFDIKINIVRINNSSSK